MVQVSSPCLRHIGREGAPLGCSSLLTDRRDSGVVSHQHENASQAVCVTRFFRPRRAPGRHRRMTEGYDRLFGSVASAMLSVVMQRLGAAHVRRAMPLAASAIAGLAQHCRRRVSDEAVGGWLG